ncbi:TetR family transcriptional regulator [Frondihabitans cladoniiphilus]|uniref:TetR family transcriptional regulator n=1 Tax=Frondihabitans cladoniiphilus TaxID=715785 RepID=A0ABP8WAG4_9MICO
MRTRDPEAKRRLLLEAATSEFAAYGIAGARVDRIAQAAGVSAGLVYTYFGSKDDLFDAVFDEIVARTMNDVPITVDDLPEYAGRLFDGYRTYPEIQRIASWHRLERSTSTGLIAAITASMEHKVEALEQAQEAGIVPTSFAAIDLLTLLLALTGVWASAEPELKALTAEHDEARRRAVVVAAVAALLAA